MSKLQHEHVDSLEHSRRIAERKEQRNKTVAAVVLATVSCLYLIALATYKPLPPRRSVVPHVAPCTERFPIPSSSFFKRQTRLAQLLDDLDAIAYIAEPGANAQYFTGVGSSQWGLSERPLLLAVKTPQNSIAQSENGTAAHNSAKPETIVLAPKFESGRARLLPVRASQLTFAEWAEEENPYRALLAALGLETDDSDSDTDTMTKSKQATIFVDPMIRKFIADGIQDAAPSTLDLKVLSAPKEIRLLRERKEPEEIEILRCANEVTLSALRAAKSRFHYGMRESDARKIVESAISAAGLKDPWALTLFGENAALPHGGGTDRVLGPTDLVLVDCGGSLHGYNSDLTRTFAIQNPGYPGIPNPVPRPQPELLAAWSAVRAAQVAVLAAASQNGSITGDVDAAARKALRDFDGDNEGGELARHGWDDWFTHRVGHGIGLEGHESPYLVGNSKDEILPGHVFSNEPGIYIEGRFGIRLEDIFVIDEDGKAVLLTEGEGGLAKSVYEF